MQFILNNRPEEIPGHQQISVQNLLDHKNFTFKFLAVRINGQPVKTESYSSTMISPGDKVTVHHLISGG